MSTSKTKITTVVVVAVMAVALVVVGLLFSGKSTPSADPGASSGQTADSKPAEEKLSVPENKQSPEVEKMLLGLNRRQEGDPLALGKVDAPVVMMDFSDYRCPYCRVFATDHEKKIIEKYVDKGLVRIEWHDAPVFGDQSILAAVAGRAAAQQNKFWQYHNLMFEEFTGRGHREVTREIVIDTAKRAGVPDMAKFEAGLDDPKLRKAVDDDAAAYNQIWGRGVPFFIVGVEPISGAQDIKVFEAVIERQIERAQAAKAAGGK